MQTLIRREAATVEAINLAGYCSHPVKVTYRTFTVLRGHNATTFEIVETASKAMHTVRS